MPMVLTLGLITPPVGVCLFVACRIGDLPISALVKALSPFFVAQLGVVILSSCFLASPPGYQVCSTDRGTVGRNDRPKRDSEASAAGPC